MQVFHNLKNVKKNVSCYTKSGLKILWRWMFAIYLRLSWNSLCSPTWLRTKDASDIFPQGLGLQVYTITNR